MKILLINVVVDKGSTGKIVRTLSDSYKKEGHSVFVLYGRGKTVRNDVNNFNITCEFESKVHHFFSNINGNIFGGMPLSTNKIIRLINKIKPDLVHIHCINGYFVNIYKLLSFLAKNKTKTILTMHADFMMTGGCGYALDCNKYISESCKNCQHFKEINGKFSHNSAHNNFLKINKAVSLFEKENLIVTCVSPWLTKRYKESNIYKNFRVETVFNPVDIKLNKNITNDDYFLYVTSDINDPNKGGHKIFEIAKNCPEKYFKIVSSKDNIKEKLENMQVIIAPSEEELAKLYSNATASILLSKKETFSMIVAESLLCGTPVLGLKAGGPETICVTEYCAFFEQNDLGSLIKSIKTFKNIYNKKAIIEEAQKLYNPSLIAKQYLRLFKNE